MVLHPSLCNLPDIGDLISGPHSRHMALFNMYEGLGVHFGEGDASFEEPHTPDKQVVFDESAVFGYRWHTSFSASTLCDTWCQLIA